MIIQGQFQFKIGDLNVAFGNMRDDFAMQRMTFIIQRISNHLILDSISFPIGLLGNPILFLKYVIIKLKRFL